MSTVSDLFKRLPIATILDEQLYDAHRKLIEHEAAAEHHAALTEMYRRRVQRLVQATARGEVADSADDTSPIDLKTGKRLRA